MKKALYVLAGFLIFGCIAASNRTPQQGDVRYDFDKRQLEAFIYKTTVPEGYERLQGKLAWRCIDIYLRYELGVNGLRDFYDCGQKTGHDFKYSELKHYGNKVEGVYYRCRKCKYPVLKTLDEINPEEKEALILLGILKKT